MSMYTTDAPSIIEHFNASVAFTPYDTKWIPGTASFVVLGGKPRGTGAIDVYKLSPSETTCVQQLEKPSAIKCGTFGASPLDAKHLATADYSGHLNIWDLDNPSKALYTVKAHKSLINTIDGVGGMGIGSGAPELATGGSDGCVKVWDPRVGDAVVRLEPAEGETARDCWSVAFGNSFNDSERCIVAGYDNGDLKLFDLRTQTIRWEGNAGNGVVSVEFDRKDIAMNKMVVTTLESKFLVYDLRTQHPKSGFASHSEKAHKATVWLGKHSPHNRDIFATTGGNGGLNIYKYHYPEKRAIKDEDGLLQGVMGKVELLNARILSSQPLVGFDWSPDKQGLASAVALDQTVRVYMVTKLHKY